MKFSAVLAFMVLWFTFSYAPIAHMVWFWMGPDAYTTAKLVDELNGMAGLLWQWGALDFAGGTVVHINAGIAGLVACIVLGKRKDSGPGHNMVLTFIGAGLLWVGWFGFNAGSALASGDRAGMAFVVTHIGAASAAIAWMLVEWVAKGKPSLLGIASGAVAGLVAITPASGFVLPSGALVIGLAAGAVCFWTATYLKNAVGYDDSLDVFGVHGVGGIVGAILTGVFAVGAVGGDAARGLIDGNPAQVWIQVKGVLWTIGWSGIASFVILKVIDLVMGLRVTTDSEREGLDLALHGESIA
jgi:Amt family ammonium transporter